MGHKAQKLKMDTKRGNLGGRDSHRGNEERRIEEGRLVRWKMIWAVDEAVFRLGRYRAQRAQPKEE